MTGADGTVQLSVVIAAHNAAAVIGTCLNALERQCRAANVEVIVADSSSDATPSVIAQRFPWVRLIHFDDPLAIPVLRGRGIQAAHGDVIAILDPFSVAAEDWVVRVLAAHELRPHAVIGGTVGLYDSASSSYAAWALYLNEYALFMPPVVQGETWIVPGSNVAYKRAALFDGATPRYPVFWKTFANWEIERTGSPPWLEPAMRVELNKPLSFSDYLSTRYLHGRCFASLRVRQASWLERLFRACTTPLVPGLLLWRWTIGFWVKGHGRGQFLLTLPVQLLLFTVWAWGEACGYLRGPGGTCERLFY
jgi:glycosyltransferase involved in cell wall biosynthesis